MLQSNLLRGTTQSGNVNTTWYLQRLKVSPDNRTHYSKKSIHIENNLDKNCKTKAGKGSTKQGQHISKRFLPSPTQIETTKQKPSLKRRLNSTYINSAKSLKPSSTTNQNIHPLPEFNSNSSETITTTPDKNILSQRQNSPDLTFHPPIPSNNQRCDRSYSSTRTSIQKQTCQLLGPQLCSDCIQIRTRANLSSQQSTNYSIRQRATALALRRFIRNENKLSDDELLEMIDNQQIGLIPKLSNQLNLSILTDDQYFDRLSKSFNRYAEQSSPYYFKDLKDFSQKYRANKSQRLLLSQIPVPTLSNPLFNQSPLEKRNMSSKYSYIKPTSTIKPNFTCQT